MIVPYKIGQCICLIIAVAYLGWPFGSVQHTGNWKICTILLKLEELSSSPLQSDHNSFKVEAEKRNQASKEEQSQLRAKAEEARGEALQLQQKIRQLEEGNAVMAATQAEAEAKAAVRFFSVGLYWNTQSAK